MSTPHEPGDNSDREAFDEFLRGGEPAIPGFQPEEIEEGERARLALIRALGDFPLLCPQCGEICEEHGHVVKVRDRILLRTIQLAQRLVEGGSLYLRAREWGVIETGELLEQLYELMDELSCLNLAAEPQELQEPPPAEEPGSEA